MEQNKKIILWGVTFGVTIAGILVLLNYLIAIDILKPTTNEVTRFFYFTSLSANKFLIIIKGTYVFTIFSLPAVIPNLRLAAPKDQRIYYSLGAIPFIFLLFLGTTDYAIIKYFLYPLSMVILFYFSPKIISLRNGLTEDEDIIGKVSQLKENHLSFTLQTDKGPLVIHNPPEGIYGEGGPGSGKSAFLVNPIIQQAVMKLYAGVCYDYEGDPLEDQPVLTKTVYNMLKLYETKTKFAFFNLTDPTRCDRANPIAKRYLKGIVAINDRATNLMLNLNPKWISDMDFWAESAISVATAILLRLQDYEDKGQNFLPNLVCLCLSNHEDLFEWLSENEDCTRIMRSTATAYEGNSMNQLSGVLASVQLPMIKLYSKEVFWALSGDDVDLDVTNKKHPTFLCVGNSPNNASALAPALSLIMSTVKQNMNQRGRQHGVYIVDELPTMFIKDLDNLPATARKKNVVTVLFNQSFRQMKRAYGEDSALITRNMCGNIFQLRTRDMDSAEYINKMLGKTKVIDESLSDSSTGTSSDTQKLIQEDVMQVRDIMGQETGHATGVIAGGKPPFFSAQLEMFDWSLLKEDIPQYTLNRVIKNPSPDPELNAEMVEVSLQHNFDRIKQESNDILAPYREKRELRQSEEERFNDAVRQDQMKRVGMMDENIDQD